MANPEWLEIFREYTPAELEQRILELKEEVSVYSAQGVGNKNYVKDLAELRGQLSAATRVRKERRNSGNPSIGVTDFSKING